VVALVHPAGPIGYPETDAAGPSAGMNRERRHFDTAMAANASGDSVKV